MGVGVSFGFPTLPGSTVPTTSTTSPASTPWWQSLENLGAGITSTILNYNLQNKALDKGAITTKAADGSTAQIANTSNVGAGSLSSLQGLNIGSFTPMIVLVLLAWVVITFVKKI